MFTWQEGNSAGGDASLPPKQSWLEHTRVVGCCWVILTYLIYPQKFKAVQVSSTSHLFSRHLTYAHLSFSMFHITNLLTCSSNISSLSLSNYFITSVVASAEQRGGDRKCNASISLCQTGYNIPGYEKCNTQRERLA